jgi:hypothetical protein
MSISAMTNVAYLRRADVRAARNTFAAIEQATGGLPETQNAVTSALNTIVTYIPTEVLTLYIAFAAALASEMSEWINFWCFLAVTPVCVWLVYCAKVVNAAKPIPLAPTAWPLWEMGAAAASFAAWAFAFPGSPFRAFSWYSGSIAGLTVLTVVTLLGLLAPIVHGASTPPTAPPPMQP